MDRTTGTLIKLGLFIVVVPATIMGAKVFSSCDRPSLLKLSANDEAEVRARIDGAIADGDRHERERRDALVAFVGRPMAPLPSALCHVPDDARGAPVQVWKGSVRELPERSFDWQWERDRLEILRNRVAAHLLDETDARTPALLRERIAQARRPPFDWVLVADEYHEPQAEKFEEQPGQWRFAPGYAKGRLLLWSAEKRAVLCVGRFATSGSAQLTARQLWGLPNDTQMQARVIKDLWDQAERLGRDDLRAVAPEGPAVYCSSTKGVVTSATADATVHRCASNEVCCWYGADHYGCGDDRQASCVPQ